MLKIVGLVFVAVLIAISAVLWPNPSGSRTDASAIPDQTKSLSVLELHLKADMKSLPVQELEDQTFVFSKRD